ncbi:MAG: hypothetical protein RJA49_2903 [Actinomycetota bacterium]
MQEFSSVSASSYDPAALAAKLTEKSADGWSVVSIVPTGGDVTAFLVREAGAVATPEADTTSAFAPALGATAVAAAATPEPEPVAAEPAGWAVAPETVAPAAAATVVAEQTAYQPAAQTAPAAQPAAQAATPAVPAGWYADPAGRFELRYWDGGTWTEHVSRAGQQYTDPPVA